MPANDTIIMIIVIIISGGTKLEWTLLNTPLSNIQVSRTAN